MKKHIIFILVLFSIVWMASAAYGAIIVGRISHVEGQIYHYMDVDQSWVETFVQSPAGTQDVLATGDNSRAEIAFPNNVVVRLAENVEIEILKLEEDVNVFALQAGLARFHNRSAAGSLAVETVMGTARVGPGSALDLQVVGNTVVVSAVQGEATFQSFDNGVEKLEVISGSTSLEFRDDSLIAGIGPIDREWDRWCGGRESVWAQNRVVRSEYLPEAMQEYAYVLEPYGSWRRIYYRGYNYWAWQPRRVAGDWAPYTTGYWYDWQGGPVWIDNNPWGWVTHHHGHWIHMQGAWMWTPYVHVSNVPGVNVVGFNITFGKTYRPYWHPGRVRWISHSSYIGWLPLAPWETYYGHRNWGPRSVTLHGGANFSINIDLAHSRYVDHAFIIPKQHFHQRGPMVINNYNTVKIKNINKTEIVRNYKPMPTIEEKRNRKRETQVTGSPNTEKRAVKQSARRTINKREAAGVEKYTQKNDLLNKAQNRKQQERTVNNGRQTTAKQRVGVIENRKDTTIIEKIPKRAARSESQAQVRKIETKEKAATARSVAVKNKPQGSRAIEARKPEKKESRQVVTQTANRISPRQEKKPVAARKTSKDEKIQVRQKSPVRQTQVQQIEERSPAKYEEESRKDGSNDRRQEAKQEKQITRAQQSGKPQNTNKEPGGARQKPGRDLASASTGNRRFR